MKSIVILGSTGSIGTNTLDIVERFPEEFRVVGLTAGNNDEMLAEQIRRFHPLAVAMPTESGAARLKQRCGGQPVEILSGPEGLAAVASLPEAELVVSAIVGGAGLVPTLAAIRSKKHIALANKEPMVMAGQLMQEEARRQGVRIFPVDSEHSAIFQSLEGHRIKDVRRLILTASGGALWNVPKEHLQDVTPERALQHPNWKMGRKITIDSATMMNKGLEVVEARWVFQMEPERIEVVIHPQSVVHSMVRYQDGSVIAQLGVPDMRIPIAYALSYPHRLRGKWESLELTRHGELNFLPVDHKRYPALELAYGAIREGGTMPVVLNGANEVAVDAFLAGRIGFRDIHNIIDQTMQRHAVTRPKEISEILRVDGWAREQAACLIKQLDSKRG